MAATETDSQSKTVTREQVFGRNGIPLRLIRIHRHSDCYPHRHEFSELVVVLRGTCIHQAPTGEYPIAAGDVFVIHGDETHGYVNTEELDLVNVLFDLDGLGIPSVDLRSLPGFHVLFSLEPMYRVRDRFDSRLRLPAQELRHIERLLTQLEADRDQAKPGWQFSAKAHFMLVLSELSRAYTHIDAPTVQPLQRLGRVLGYLERHYRDSVSLAELAQAGNMSRRNLTRAFRDAMGCSPIQYLLRVRIQRAIELLQEGETTVSEVALAVGFNDSNYFARQFHKVMGYPPREILRHMSVPGAPA
ncbi:MAG: helix-turn-helix domain-containing protein [Lentisphaeria bacterium]|nr:helix-turn-helix domain-containing protein [Lentisphaeria bacterium]